MPQQSNLQKSQASTQGIKSSPIYTSRQEADVPFIAGSGAKLMLLMYFPAPTMELSALKTVVHKFYADGWNKHDKSAIPALLQSDFTFRGSLGQCKYP
jgi:hypothetical protein